MSRLMRGGTTAEPVLRGQILRRERGQGNIHFPCSADHQQDWQPYYPGDTYSCYMYDLDLHYCSSFIWCSLRRLKKKMSASRPCEHLPVRGGKCQKVYLGGIIDCKDTRVLMVFIVTLGQHYHVGDVSVAQFMFE